MTEPTRCSWAGPSAEYLEYHDHEWGRPVTDDRRLFEKVCLEGFQSGLSWLTILRKRDAFRAAFAGFDPEQVAAFGDAEVQRLLTDTGIVRHRGKITATINNAARALELIDERGSLASYFWSFEPLPVDRPARMDPDTVQSLVTSPASVALSKDLKRRGWRFVGPTTMYALMQAMGLVNDHVEECWVRGDVESARAALLRP